MLERVRLSRVFDFPGVAEAIGEFGARLDEEEKTRRNRVDAKGFEKARDIAEGEERAENSLSVEEDNNTITRTTAANPEAVEYLPASMIVIDNIANVVGSMMTKSQAHGILEVAPLKFGDRDVLTSFRTGHTGELYAVAPASDQAP